MKLTLFGKEITIFRWPKKSTYYIVAAFVLGFTTLMFIQECQGAEFELGVGVSIANLPDLDPEGETVKAAFIFWEKVEVAGRYYNDQLDGLVDDYWAVSIGYKAKMQVDWAIKPYLTLGIAYADAPNYLLSQDFNFGLSGGLIWRQWQFEYHHFSNAGLEEPNRGQNSFMLSYIWEF